MVEIWKDLFMNKWNCVLVNGVRSRYRLQLIGGSQGRIAMQYLCKLYLDPLYYIITKPEKYVIIIYVDDIIIWSKLQHFEVHMVQDEMQCEVYNLVYWLDGNNMKAKLTKAKYMIFYTKYVLNYLNNHNGSTNIITKESLYLTLQIDTLILTKPVQTIKYLGYNLDHNLSCVPQIKHLIRQINGDLYHLKTYVPNIHFMYHKYVYQYINAISISKIIYSSILFYNNTITKLKPLQVAYNKINRYYFNSPYVVPIDVLNLLSPFLLLKNLIDVNLMKAWIHLLFIADNNALYSVIEREWFPRWCKYAATRKYDTKMLKMQSNPLWKLFCIIDKHKLYPHCHFHAFQQYINYIPDVPYLEMPCILPSYIQYDESPYDGWAQYNYTPHWIFAYTDASLQENPTFDDVNKFAGIGRVISQI